MAAFNDLESSLELLFLSDSPMSKAVQGIGFITLETRAESGFRYPIEDAIVSPLQNPQTMQEKLIASYRQTTNNPDFVKYVVDKMPESMKSLEGFSEDPKFPPEPFIDTSFVYDAVTAFGIGMCQTPEEFPSAKGIIEPLMNVTFEGATGKFLLDEHGSRVYKTVTFVVYNSIARNPINGSGSPVGLNPVFGFEKGEWFDISDDVQFIFGDGSTIPPIALSPLNNPNDSVNPIVLVGGIALLLIIMLSSLCCLYWTLQNIQEPVVCASQASFLVLIAGASFLSSLSVVPLAIQESNVPNETKDVACLAVPWLFNVGVSLAISAIMAKLWRLREVGCQAL